MAGPKSVYNSPVLATAVELMSRRLGVSLNPEFITYEQLSQDAQIAVLRVTALPVTAEGKPAKYRGTVDFPYRKVNLENLLPQRLVYDREYPVTFERLRDFLLFAYDFQIYENEFEVVGEEGNGLGAGDQVTVPYDANNQFHLRARDTGLRWQGGGQIHFLSLSGITMPEQAPTITGRLNNPEVGVEYSGVLSLDGGTGTYHNARISSGTFPPGMTYEIVGDIVQLGGTPTLSGPHEFTLAVDSGTGVIKQTATITFNLDVQAPPSVYTSRLRFEGPAGSQVIVDDEGHAWTANGSGQIVDEPLMPNGKAYYVGNSADHLASNIAHIDLTGTPFTLEFYLVQPQAANNGYESSFVQYGFGYEGDGGFALGSFSSHGGTKPLRLRFAYDILVDTPQSIQAGVLHHVTVVGNGQGQMWTCLDGQSWSPALQVGANTTAQRFYFGNVNGSWKQVMPYRIGDIRIKQGEMLYTPGTPFDPYAGA